MSITRDAIRRAVLVAYADSASFSELFAIAELDRRNALIGASLNGANLRNQDLCGFNFTDASFVSADLRGADLSNTVGLCLDSIRFAIIDATTKLPRCGGAEMRQMLLLREIADQRRSKHPAEKQEDKLIDTLEPPSSWDMAFYWKLHHAGLWSQLEVWCEKITMIEPDNDEAARWYAHLLGVHLEHPDEAEAILLRLIDKSPYDPNLQYEYAKIIARVNNRDTEALNLAQYELSIISSSRDKMIWLDFAFGVMTHAGRRQFYEDDIKNNIEQRLTISKSCDDLNSVAWAIYITGGNLETALDTVAKARRIDRDDVPALQTHMAILARMGRKRSIKRLFASWLEKIDAETIISSWDDFEDMFVDLIKIGYGKYILELLKEKLT